ncbi:MAG TPA: DnaJ domain-containing protein [Capsulimonadaceae bacterium]|nr:DnaJ domain-containing protein [Capsulimonadaceae bacterium]
MNSQLDHYEVLGLPKNAKPDQIRAKFHELARVFHPDRYRAEDGDTAQRTFVRINEAYNTLINSEKREKYDRKLKAAGGKHDVAMCTTKDGGPIEATSTDQIKQWLDEALSAYAKGKLGPARELCEKAINFDYSEWSAHALLGDIHADRGRISEALECYRLALLLNPGSSIVREKIRRLEGLSVASMEEKPQKPKARRGLPRIFSLFSRKQINERKTETGKSMQRATTIPPTARQTTLR